MTNPYPPFFVTNVPDEPNTYRLVCMDGETVSAAFGLSFRDAERAQRNGSGFVPWPNVEPHVATGILERIR